MASAEILTRPEIKDYLAQIGGGDLWNNNQRLGVVVPLYKDCKAQLKEYMVQILSDNFEQANYYQLKHILQCIRMENPHIVVNELISIVEEKLSHISELVIDNPNIDFPMYIQFWKSYSNFCDKLRQLFKEFFPELVERKIKCGKMNFDLFMILKTEMFYRQVICKINPNFFNEVKIDISNVNSKNVDQLLEYIDSIHTLIDMKDFVKVDSESLRKIIKNIISDLSIVNIFCGYIDRLLTQLKNGNAHIDYNQYETISMESSERYIISKLYKLTSILFTYSEKEKVLLCYRKFFQARIMDSRYNNWEIEIVLIRRLSRLLKEKESQKMVYCIEDMLESRKYRSKLHEAEIKIVNPEYSGIPFDPKCVNPIILTKANWTIYNTSELNPNYPIEMKIYLALIENGYYNSYQNEYTINWQPTMGRCRLEAILGKRKVYITCNMLQSMAMCYANHVSDIIALKFASETCISEELALKILDSLCDASVFVKKARIMGQQIYGINHNYSGPSCIDVRKIFIETLEIEISNSMTKPTLLGSSMSSSIIPKNNLIEEMGDETPEIVKPEDLPPLDDEDAMKEVE
jgi:thiol-disulfide isomerase/thioredoxin